MLRPSDLIQKQLDYYWKRETFPRSFLEDLKVKVAEMETEIKAELDAAEQRASQEVEHLNVIDL